ncbi:hypothetical protein N665_0158s0080 [Sinapis alba]|nr:hypothetical protein N665_0158s0080 [Sinapis alba]
MSVPGLENLHDNMDLFEAEIGGVVVTGAEGWSAQHGEASLNSRVGFDDGDEADSQPATETQPLETETQRQTQPAVHTHSGSSRAKKKRKEKDMVVDACIKRTEALEVKNKIAERMLEREEACSIENVLGILNALPGVIEWSPLYNAAMLERGYWKMRMKIMMMNLVCLMWLLRD